MFTGKGIPEALHLQFCQETFFSNVLPRSAETNTEVWWLWTELGAGGGRKWRGRGMSMFYLVDHWSIAKMRNLVQLVTKGFFWIHFPYSFGIAARAQQFVDHNPWSRLALNTIKTTQEQGGTGEQIFAWFCMCILQPKQEDIIQICI